MEKVRWAIFPKMPEERGDENLGISTGIFKGCISIRPVLRNWKSYTRVKDLRPISLTSFLLKTLKRLVKHYTVGNMHTLWKHPLGDKLH